MKATKQLNVANTNAERQKKQKQDSEAVVGSSFAACSHKDRETKH